MIQIQDYEIVVCVW